MGKGLARMSQTMPIRPGPKPVLTIASRQLPAAEATPLWRGTRLAPGHANIYSRVDWANQAFVWVVDALRIVIRPITKCIRRCAFGAACNARNSRGTGGTGGGRACGAACDTPGFRGTRRPGDRSRVAATTLSTWPSARAAMPAPRTRMPRTRPAERTVSRNAAAMACSITPRARCAMTRTS